MSTAGAHWVRRRVLTEPRRPASVRHEPASALGLSSGTVCIGAFMGQLGREHRDVGASAPGQGSARAYRCGRVGGVRSSGWHSSYLLVLVATVAIVGRIADAIGRKLLYVYGFGPPPVPWTRSELTVSE